MDCCMSSSRPACRHPWGVQHSVPFFFAQLSCEEKKEIEEIENICSCFMEIEEKYIFTILVFVRFIKISPNLWEGDDRKLLAILLNNFCSLCKMWWCIWLMPIIETIGALFSVATTPLLRKQLWASFPLFEKTDMIKYISIYWNKKYHLPSLGLIKKQIRSNVETKSITSLLLLE